MPATTRSRILTTRSLCHYENDSSRSKRPAAVTFANLDESFLRWIGPIGQLAEQSVIVGQLANHRTYAGSRRPHFTAVIASRVPLQTEQAKRSTVRG